MIKIIALGNILMKDDGVAIEVLKSIESNLKREVIYGETDFSYCLDKINDGDEVILIDSTYLGLRPGTVTVEDNVTISKPSSQHQVSLVNMIHEYKKDIRIFFIGIEIGKVEFGLGLSDELSSEFDEICREVLEKIKRG